MEVTEAIRNRKSARAFLDKAVPDEIVTEILECARWAPSGANTQPWHVAVLTGETKRQLGDAMVKRRISGEKPRPDYNYYPTKSEEPYISRKYACADALYSALCIERKDIERRKMQWIKNYHHFGAPVALLFLSIRFSRKARGWIPGCSSKTSCSPPAAMDSRPARKPPSPSILMSPGIC